MTWRVSFTINENPVAKGRHRSAIVQPNEALNRQLLRMGEEPIPAKLRNYTPKKTSNFETTIHWMSMEARHKAGLRQPFAGAVFMLLKIFVKIPKSTPNYKIDMMHRGELRPTTKPDWSNYLKAVEDGMNGVVYVDDAQIVGCLPGCGKYYDDGRGPRIEVTVIPFDGIPT